MGNQEKKKPDLNQYNSAARFAGLGFQIASTVGGLTVAGYYLDKYLNTLPLFMVILCMAALAGNIYMLIKSGGSDTKD